MGLLFIKSRHRRSAAPLLLVAATLSCSGQPAPEKTRYFASLVGKGEVDHFYTRMASNDDQLVVTSEPVAGAKDTVFVSVGSAEELFVVELPREDEPPLEGEQARLGRFALILGPQYTDPHVVLGRHDLFAQRLSGAMVEPPAPLPVTDGLQTMMSELENQAAALRGLEDARSDLQEGLGAHISVDRAYVEQKVKEMSGAIPVVIEGRTLSLRDRRSGQGRDDVRLWLKREYEALGFEVSEHRYGSGFSNGINFVATRVGRDAGRHVILSSHIDSVGNAGADDNAAGTVTALAVANALQGYDLKFGLKILGFDQEENGLLGSAAYARMLREQGTLGELVGVINLEMTGYDDNGDGAFHAIDCNENTSSELSRLVVEAALADAGLQLRKSEACTNRSDHASFWRYDKPAIVVSEDFFGGDSNPCYHRICDTVTIMNFDYMARLSTAVARATYAWIVAE